MPKLDQTPTTGPALLTQAAYAASRKARGLSGGTKQSVNQAVDANRISTIGPDKLIDPAVADIQWEQNSRRRAVGVNVQGGAQPSGRDAATAAPAQAAMPLNASAEGMGQGVATETPDAAPAKADNGYADARTARERAEAAMAELKLGKESGRLVERSAVELAVREAFGALRDRLLSMPREAAPGVVGMADVRQIELKLEEHMRKAFEGYEEQMRSKIAARMQA